MFKHLKGEGRRSSLRQSTQNERFPTMKCQRCQSVGKFKLASVTTWGGSCPLGLSSILPQTQIIWINKNSSTPESLWFTLGACYSIGLSIWFCVCYMWCCSPTLSYFCLPTQCAPSSKTQLHALTSFYTSKTNTYHFFNVVALVTTVCAALLCVVTVF